MPRGLLLAWVLTGLFLTPPPVVAASGEDTVHADPLALWQERTNEFCAAGWKDDIETPAAPVIPRGNGILEPDFADRHDLDGDGTEDLILHLDRRSCEGGRNGGWCGTAGCLTEIWFSQPDGQYRRALRTHVRWVKATIFDGQPAISFTSHGVGCGRSGTDNCRDIRVWTGTELRRVWTDYDINKLRPRAQD